MCLSNNEAHECINVIKSLLVKRHEYGAAGGLNGTTASKSFRARNILDGNIVSTVLQNAQQLSVL